MAKLTQVCQTRVRAMWIFGLSVLLVSIVALAFLLAPRTPKPQTVKSRAELITYLEAVSKSGVASAISVAIMRGDDLIWEHAVGTANPFMQTPATPNTIYHWFSVTKIATAMAVLDLVEDNLITLDTEVSQVLPFFAVNGLKAGSEPITVRHLLNHTSGLPDTVPSMFGWLRYDQQEPSQTDFLHSVLPEFNKLRFQPGTDRRYSNLGYMVLGAIVEQVTGDRFETVIEKRVLHPVGMTDSSFLFADGDPNEALGSHPILHVFTPLLPFYINLQELVARRIGMALWFHRFYVNATPPTGLVGTARDFALLGQAALQPSKMLDHQMLDLMMPPIDTIPLGWNATDGTNQKWYQHLGGGPGFAAVLRVYPDQGCQLLSSEMVLR